MNTYRVVRNDDRGVQHNIRKDPVRSIMSSCQSLYKDPECGDLDQTLTVSISGLGDVMPDEFERVIEGQYPDVKPTVITGFTVQTI